jgi:hypothetical protein
MLAHLSSNKVLTAIKHINEHPRTFSTLFYQAMTNPKIECKQSTLAIEFLILQTHDT